MNATNPPAHIFGGIPKHKAWGYGVNHFSNFCCTSGLRDS
jgi:hypothetical protein